MSKRSLSFTITIRFIAANQASLYPKSAIVFDLPSADQPAEMRNQAALIVKYPIPIEIESNSYEYFILWADSQHIQMLSKTLSFL